MMSDDHGWEETGYNGHPHVKTPVLDEMAAAGLKFDRFYAAHPSCSPTRASFLNFHHPEITDADYRGTRSIIEGDHKLVIREQKDGTSIELFNLKTDPDEKINLRGQQPELARKLQSALRQWQDSVLKSLTGADYL